jgi:dipeptidyl-peptidase-4
MKKLHLILFVALLFICNNSFSQKKEILFDDIMNWKLYPWGYTNLQWQDNDNFTYYADGKIVKENAHSGNTDTILSLDELNRALSSINVEEMKFVPYSFKWLSPNEFCFNYNNDSIRILLNIDTQKAEVIATIPKNAENNDYLDANKRFAYTIDNNLYVYFDGNHKAITQYPDTGIVAGKTVHRSEFGINKGTFWSPKGNMLAFYLNDESMVTKYPLVDINTRIATEKSFRYPMAGMTSHQVKLGIYNTITDKISYINTGEPKEQYLTNIAWSPDEKYIFIAIINRGQDHMKFNMYDVATGNYVRTLFEETSDKYVEPQNSMYFLKNDPELFIWQSRRDGYNHLYLYNINGELVKQITKGEWEVVDFDGLNSNETTVFFTATKEGPLQRHYYSCNIDNGKLKKLTKAEGTHSVVRNSDGNLFIDVYNSVDVPYKATLVNEKGKQQRILKEVDNPLAEYNTPEVELITLKSEHHNYDLYARMIKPTNFDKNKKYPVLVYVYGGPHSQLVSNSWLGGGNLFFYYLASNGYIVWTLDNRGTSNRGADFEQVIHRNLGYAENQDQMTGVNYLKSLPYVDDTRIGVDGWSYGGFMALTLMSRNEGVFKVTTAGGPVTDWKYYEIMYGERYMDTPDENPEVYKNSSLLNYADKLNGKVMVIHGAIDNVVVWQHSLQYLDKCIKAGKQIDYFVYPNHEHNVRGKDRMHLYKKLSDYYFDNL